MRITGGFDDRHGKFYFVSLMAMAFASALMLVVALRGINPVQVAQEVAVLVAASSLLCSTASYLLIKRVKYSFPLLGVSAVVFSGALWAFGAPLLFALLLGLPALLLSLISIICRDKADVQVERDD